MTESPRQWRGRDRNDGGCDTPVVILILVSVSGDEVGVESR